MSARAAVFAAALFLAASAASQASAKLPSWDGLWQTEGDATSIGGLSDAAIEARLTGKGSVASNVNVLYGFGAPWNDEGKRRQAARRGNGNRKADGWGFPMMMDAAAPIQFFITPKKVMVVNAYRDVTDVRVGEKHPSADDLWPTVWGDSVGRWEGDTLVIDTIAVKNPNEYFHGGPPLSENAHYVQRIRMDKPNHLIDDIVIEDPTTLTGAWKAHLSFVPAEGFERMVYDNYDNDRTDSEGGTIAPPKDEKPGGQ